MYAIIYLFIRRLCPSDGRRSENMLEGPVRGFFFYKNIILKIRAQRFPVKPIQSTRHVFLVKHVLEQEKN